MNNNVKKVGYLKMDLYGTPFDNRSGNYRSHIKTYHLVTAADKEELINEFNSQFDVALPQGSKFVCFMNRDGSESWFDDVNYGIEDMDGAWAKKYLEKIETIDNTTEENLMY